MKINLPRTPLSLILVALLSLITWESCRNRPTEDGTLAFHQNFPGDKIPVFEMKYGDRRINEISISRNGKDGWAVGNSGIIKFWNGNKWVLHEQGSAVTNLDLLVLFVLEDQNEAWAFGRKGVCLSYKDGNWKIDEQLSSMSGHDWNGCWFNPAGTHGLVVGNYGQILQLIDGKWSLYHNEKLLSQKLAIISYLDLEEVEVSESMNEGWIVGKSGMILKVSGPVWDIQVYQGGTPSAHLWDVKLSRDGKIGWISGEGGVILRKNGVNWETFGKGTQLPNQRLTTISFTKDGHQVWVAGSHNTLISIKGDKWKQVSAKGMARRSNLFYASDWNESTKQLWLGGEGGQMVVIDKDGIWTEYGDLLLGTAAVICKIRMSEDNSRGWAVGRDGDILAYKFGKWSEVKHSFPKLWYQGLWVNKVGTRGWAVGSDGVVLSMNEGEWTIDSMASGLCKKQLNAVWMRDDLSKGVIVGDAGAVLEYYAGAWHDKSDSLVAKLDFSAADLWINEMGTKGWAVGEGGRIFKYDGYSWAKYEPASGKWPTVATLDDLWVDESGDNGWAVGDRVILKLEDGEWKIHDESTRNASLRLTSMTMNKEGTYGFAVGSRGVILHYSEKKGFWELVPGAGKITYKYLAASYWNDKANEGWLAGYNLSLIRITSFEVEDPVLDYPLGQSPFVLTGAYSLTTKHKIDSAKIAIRTEAGAYYANIAEIKPIEGSGQWKIEFKKSGNWAINELAGKNCWFELVCWYKKPERIIQIAYSSMVKPGPLTYQSAVWQVLFVAMLFLLLGVSFYFRRYISRSKQDIRTDFQAEISKSSQEKKNSSKAQVSKECLEIIFRGIWKQIVQNHCKMRLSYPASRELLDEIKKDRKPFKIISQEKAPFDYGFSAFPDAWLLPNAWKFSSASLINWLDRLNNGQASFDVNHTLNAFAAYYYRLKGEGPREGERNTSEQNYIYIKRIIEEFQKR